MRRQNFNMFILSRGKNRAAAGHTGCTGDRCSEIQFRTLVMLKVKHQFRTLFSLTDQRSVKDTFQAIATAETIDQQAFQEIATVQITDKQTVQDIDQAIVQITINKAFRTLIWLQFRSLINKQFRTWILDKATVQITVQEALHITDKVTVQNTVKTSIQDAQKKSAERKILRLHLIHSRVGSTHWWRPLLSAVVCPAPPHPPPALGQASWARCCPALHSHWCSSQPISIHH